MLSLASACIKVLEKQTRLRVDGWFVWKKVSSLHAAAAWSPARKPFAFICRLFTCQTNQNNQRAASAVATFLWLYLIRLILSLASTSSSSSSLWFQVMADGYQPPWTGYIAWFCVSYLKLFVFFCIFFLILKKKNYKTLLVKNSGIDCITTHAGSFLMPWNLLMVVVNHQRIHETEDEQRRRSFLPTSVFLLLFTSSPVTPEYPGFFFSLAAGAHLGPIRP